MLKMNDISSFYAPMNNNYIKPKFKVSANVIAVPRELGIRPYARETDKISFTGNLKISSANKDEINELINIFYESLNLNLDFNKKTPKILKIVDKFLSTAPFRFIANRTAAITKTVKHNNKIVGGYSMTKAGDDVSHLSFITLAPEFMRTKSGLAALIQMGLKICEDAELNGIKNLKFTTNAKNKNINKLLKRLYPTKIREIMSETEYSIEINDLKNKLEIINVHFSL